MIGGSKIEITLIRDYSMLKTIIIEDEQAICDKIRCMINLEKNLDL